MRPMAASIDVGDVGSLAMALLPQRGGRGGGSRLSGLSAPAGRAFARMLQMTAVTPRYRRR
ncbi:hypothetical protein XAR_2006 [Xanthomonas citri pv. glycines str. 8ra]|nr:hypothetical protein XAR_2006 [Xanthomonas citri pv. glycines str. 8ra]